MRHRSSLRFPPPRLLPLVIVAMAALLVIKSGDVVRAATNAAPVSAPAQAASAVRPAVLQLAAVSSPPAPPAPAPAPAAGPQAGLKGLAPSKPAAPSGAPEPAKPGQPSGAGSCGTDPARAPLGSPEAGAAPVTDNERKLLTELRQRRLQLDAREAAIAGREATLNAVDRRLTTRVTELAALQRKLEDLEKERKARDEANWNGLVKTYETMKPRDAAAIFNDLEPSVLLPVLDRMKESKMAPILAAMQPERARLATIGLAQMRLKANQINTAVPASQPGGVSKPSSG
jgi:flagellar motility protein MotE (MotC chaperone)